MALPVEAMTLPGRSVPRETTSRPRDLAPNLRHNRREPLVNLRERRPENNLPVRRYGGPRRIFDLAERTDQRRTPGLDQYGAVPGRPRAGNQPQQR